AVCEPGLQRPGTAPWADRAPWDLLLLVSDLLRLLRILPYRDRRRENHGNQPHDQLQAAVLRGFHRGLLEAVAHLPVQLVSGLSLHPSRRKPRAGLALVPQSHDRLPRQRVLAWSELDVPHLGGPPRHLPRRSDRAGSASIERPGPAPPSWNGVG